MCNHCLNEDYDNIFDILDDKMCERKRKKEEANEEET